MRRIFVHIGLLLIFAFMPILLLGQQPLAYPLDTIDGKIYYRYTVERSIGLYRLSVNFGVSQEEILRANPIIQEKGLRYDEVILIPAKGLEVKPAVVAPPAPVVEPVEQPFVAPAPSAPSPRVSPPPNTATAKTAKWAAKDMPQILPTAKNKRS